MRTRLEQLEWQSVWKTANDSYTSYYLRGGEVFIASEVTAKVLSRIETWIWTRPGQKSLLFLRNQRRGAKPAWNG